MNIAHDRKSAKVGLEPWPGLCLLLLLLLLAVGCAQEDDEPSTPTAVAADTDEPRATAPPDDDGKFRSDTLGIRFDLPAGWVVTDLSETEIRITSFEGIEPPEGISVTLAEFSLLPTAQILVNQTFADYVATAPAEFGTALLSQDNTALDGREATRLVLQQGDSLGIIAFVENGGEILVFSGAFQKASGVPSERDILFVRMRGVIESVEFLE